ncbi:MAG: ImmA/IrrE family metallo-endopeptidase [Erysipelotrichia bacterium]|nr:ImmA/IrrE family metallo-endopeptidase [Erysipelotrichia bacterium]
MNVIFRQIISFNQKLCIKFKFKRFHTIPPDLQKDYNMMHHPSVRECDIQKRMTVLKEVDAMTQKQKSSDIIRLTDCLQNGIRSLYMSEQYQAYLNAMSHFHNYSFKNSMLIFQQRPNATLVAGYRLWQKQFDRHVNKGEKGIRILVPVKSKKESPLQNDEKQDHKIYYRTASVFDISQTSGRELPLLAVHNLEGSVQDYAGFMETLKLVSPVPILFSKDRMNVNGYYSRKDLVIVISSSLSQIQTIKTMIHEISHSLLHTSSSGTSTAEREVQAESIAYTVCRRFGIDTSDYSFAYIAGCCSSQSLEELTESMEIICSTADALISSIIRLHHPEAAALISDLNIQQMRTIDHNHQLPF